MIVFGGITPCFLERSSIVRGRMILRWTSCLGGWESEMVSQMSLRAGLGPHLVENVPPLVGQIFVNRLFHVLQKIDACGAIAHVSGELFGQKPFMLQNFRPQVGGDFGLELYTGHLENLTRAFLHRKRLRYIIVHGDTSISVAADSLESFIILCTIVCKPGRLRARGTFILR